MTDLAFGQAEAKRLASDLSNQNPDLNEADTRHQFIDRLIHECLGWDRTHNTKVERHFNGDYSDYELGTPPQVVIEAKRAGLTFELPTEGTTSIVRSLRSLIINSPALGVAVNQTLRYCAERGIQIGVVANASQLVIFLGVRSDGVPPLDGKCLVFSGLEQIAEKFSRLW